MAGRLREAGSREAGEGSEGIRAAARFAHREKKFPASSLPSPTSRETLGLLLHCARRLGNVYSDFSRAGFNGGFADFAARPADPDLGW